MATVRRSRRAPRGRIHRGRTGTELEGRVVPLQRERVQRGRLRDVQDARRPRQRELPLPRGRARVPPRQLRRRGAAVPRRAGRPRRQGARPCPEREALDPGGRRQRAAGLRGAVRAAARRARADGAHRAQRRRPLLPLHRRHHRHAQGRDVAQRGPLRRARRGYVSARRQEPAGPRPRHGCDRQRAGRRGREPCAPARVPVDARHRRVQHLPGAVPRRRGRDARRSALRRARALGDSAARTRDADGDRRRRVREADGARARGSRGRRQAVRPVVDRPDHQLGRHVVEPR